MSVGSQGTPGKHGLSAQVTWCGDPRLTPAARSGWSSTPTGWLCGTAGAAGDFLSMDDVILTLTGLVFLPGGRLAEADADAISFTGFDLGTCICASTPPVTVPWPVKHWKLEEMA